ncbi:MAG: MXAN_5187 family protein [Myxococcota bacterium]
MILSRFWYAVLGAALAFAAFLLFLSTSVANRNAQRTADQLLTAASRSVGWYLADDARTRATALIPLSLDPDLRETLAAANGQARMKDVDAGGRAKVKAKLARWREKRPSGKSFDAVWAVDRFGRVVANDNFERGTDSEYFELGGYSVVADALHGWIRDDAWVLDGRIYKVVARPVENAVNSTPVGAVIAAKIVDDAFVQSISDSTGAAVAFFANATRIATGAPPDFNRVALEVNASDIEALSADEDYQSKGRTAPLVLRRNSGFDTSVVFARMRGEAWDLGAGFVVGHRQATVSGPLEYQRLANDADKAAVPTLFIVLAAIGAVLVGLLLSLLEHTAPLAKFRRAIHDLADKRSDTDVLKPSVFRGTFRGIASNVNDALDKVAAQAGVDRGPADLESVLGPLPAQPQMSAFAVPDGSAAGTPEASPSKPKAPVPKPRASRPRRRPAPERPSRDETAGKAPAAAASEDQEVTSTDRSPTADRAAEEEPAPDTEQVSTGLSELVDPEELGAVSDAKPSSASPRPPPAAPSRPEAPAKKANRDRENDADGDDGGGGEDEEREWRRVYEEFRALKEELGESTKKLTYEKFRGTLQRNKEALIARHQCQRVKFRVYEKQGRAALKASPVK